MAAKSRQMADVLSIHQITAVLDIMVHWTLATGHPWGARHTSIGYDHFAASRFLSGLADAATRQSHPLILPEVFFLADSQARIGVFRLLVGLRDPIDRTCFNEEVFELPPEGFISGCHFVPVTALARDKQGRAPHYAVAFG
jgi:hypothetical protein